MPIDEDSRWEVAGVTIICAHFSLFADILRCAPRSCRCLLLQLRINSPNQLTGLSNFYRMRWNTLALAFQQLTRLELAVISLHGLYDLPPPEFCLQKIEVVRTAFPLLPRTRCQYTERATFNILHSLEFFLHSQCRTTRTCLVPHRTHMATRPYLTSAIHC